MLGEMRNVVAVEDRLGELIVDSMSSAVMAVEAERGGAELDEFRIGSRG